MMNIAICILLALSPVLLFFVLEKAVVMAIMGTIGILLWAVLWSVIACYEIDKIIEAEVRKA